MSKQSDILFYEEFREVEFSQNNEVYSLSPIAANFASFAIVKFSVAADSIANFGIGNILRHWGVTFIGNFIGGGLLVGLPYAFLNKDEDTYVD